MLAFDVPVDGVTVGETAGRMAAGVGTTQPQAATQRIRRKRITPIFMKGVVITGDNNGYDPAGDPGFSFFKKRGYAWLDEVGPLPSPYLDHGWNIHNCKTNDDRQDDVQAV